jgi:hypothetical protein
MPDGEVVTEEVEGGVVGVVEAEKEVGHEEEEEEARVEEEAEELVVVAVVEVSSHCRNNSSNNSNSNNHRKQAMRIPEAREEDPTEIVGRMVLAATTTRVMVPAQ